jgi:hypothetical protein
VEIIAENMAYCTKYYRFGERVYIFMISYVGNDRIVDTFVCVKLSFMFL